MGLKNKIFIGIPQDFAADGLAVLSFKEMRNIARNPQDAPAGGSNAQPNAQWERFKAVSHLMNPTTFNMRRVREASIPSANGHASALALAQFYARLFSRDEAYDSLLTWSTYQRCLENELPPATPASGANTELQFSTGTGTALGFQVFNFRRKTDGKIVKGLGHGGFGGSIGLAIPEEGLAFAVTVNDLHVSRVGRPAGEILAEVAAHYGLEQIF